MAKKKRRVRIKQKAQVRKKGEGDSIKKAPFQPLRDTGASFRVKLKRKGK
jgi:hypothetical protein